ncbi:osmotically inducible protein OsmC [Flavobacteriaceae bacterium MAR_2010_188]|nr:osmotically inducible protein OsmC [Flavobacteriaceae bacterium MAR_2010_188]
MKFNRTASAHWEGGGEEGRGGISTQSGALNGELYEFKTRFKDKKGTNPEELVGAAHAGCYTMQLAFFIEEEGHTAQSLDTEARVHFEDGKINQIDLSVKGKVPGMNEKDFAKVAEKAKKECPLSKLLNANISLEVEFVD